jgi:hypothetical protein
MEENQKYGKKDKPPSANKNKNLINTGKNHTFQKALQF